MNKSTADHYLRDLGDLLRRIAIEAKREADASKGTPQQDFRDGRLLAFNEVISLMQQQAVAFGLPLTAISLDGINPDSELV